MNFHQDPVTYVGDVSLKVQDLKRSITFYREVIGFEVLNQTERKANLTADGKTVLLTIEQPEDIGPKQQRTTGLFHFAILLPERFDLGSIIRHFAEAGVQLGAADHLVSEAIYLDDPDGNGIEVYADRDPSEWKWNNGEVNMSNEPLDFPDLLSIAKQPWKGLPAGTVIGHIHLHVSDLKETEEFYIKGLGFEVVNHFGLQALFVADGNYHHHIGLNTWNGAGAPAPSPNSAGLDSFTLKISSMEKINSILKNIKKMGYSFSEEKDAAVVTDPSGNRIRLSVQNSTGV